MAKNRQCKIDSCTKKEFRDGWCMMHHKRNERYGDPAGKPDRLVEKKPVSSFVIDRHRLYTNAEIARLFNMNGRSLASKLESVRPSGEENGKLTYALADAGKAIWARTVTKVSDEDDPYFGLSPAERKYQVESEIKYIELQDLLGDYTITHETHRFIAEKFKELDLGLSAIPDEIERAAGLTPEQLSVVDRVLNKIRRNLVA